jgi:hypothetical protein
MRWLTLFRRRRRLVGGDVGLPDHRPGSWAEIALPPCVEPEPADATAPPAQLAAPAKSPAPQPVHQLMAAPIVPRQSRVRLGFADGTSVDLEEESGTSEELKATASRLLGATES